MGTWGTALFSDDTASDVRDDFKTYIGDGLTPEAATAAMFAEWGSTVNDADVGPIFWLALASTQWTLGRLVPEVLKEAMRILDSSGDLNRWALDEKMVSKRHLHRLVTCIASGYFERVQKSTLVCGVPSGLCNTTVSIMCLPSSDIEKTRVLAGCPSNPPPITKILRLGMVIDTTS
jgi:hypothetical protein